jgi:cob(I)alamin adenosyltransferase
MVKLNRIYTRTGDGGDTGLGNGERRSKADRRVAAFGDVDETNCAIGLARQAIAEAPNADLARIEAFLARVQNDLFDLGADLCVPEVKGAAPATHPPLRVTMGQVDAIERAIDQLNAHLRPLRSFVLPGGARAASALHLARAICRRAERGIVELAATSDERVGAPVLAYINRLSDYLFVAARFANDRGRADVLWVPGASQNAQQ